MTTTSTPLPPRRGRWRSWLLALLIFCGGAACGSGLTAVLAVRAIRHNLQHPETAAARITARLSRRLDLTSAQAAQVEAIIAARQQNLQRIRRQVQPQVELELLGLETEISGILTPAQQPQWKTMLTTLRENLAPEAAATRAIPQ
jgi:hypothetical protein